MFFDAIGGVFFIAVQTKIVLFPCHVSQCLASWGKHGWIAPPPGSATVRIDLQFQCRSVARWSYTKS